MSEIKIFENPEFGSVRTVEVNGEPYFVGKDVAEILGYSNVNKAIQMHVDDEDKKTLDFKGFSHLGTSLWSGNDFSNKAVINESGLYSLIFSSKLSKAKEFKHWVTSEVLPSIRKHGAYMTDEALHRAITEPDFLIKLATELKEEKEKRKALEGKVEQDKPLVDFATQVSKSSDLIDIAQMAKLAQDENINIGRNKLFEWLREKKILMNNNNPYQRFIDQGFFQLKEITKNTPYGDKIFLKTLVTGKGQIYIIQKLKAEFCN